MHVVMSWTDRLRGLIESGNFTTQSRISAALSESGFSLNQATISRELKRLGVRKVDGVYRIPRQQLTAPIHRMSVTAGGCMVVLHTNPAFASVVAQRIDHSRAPGILGTIAGDDTVFVATTGPEGVAAIQRVLSLPTDETPGSLR